MENITNNSDLNNFAQILRESGFTIIAPEKSSTWFNFWDENSMGYVQDDLGGFNLSSEHKPCREAGTGYRVLSELAPSQLTVVNAKKACSKIVWREHSGKIKFWDSIEQFLNYPVNRILKYRILKPIETLKH